MMDHLDLLQWPAMVASVVAAWLVGAQSKRRRTEGFWCFLLSNVLWVAWAWPAHAWAVAALQFALAALNFRGLAKNHPTNDHTSAGSEIAPRHSPSRNELPLRRTVRHNRSSP